ncbi:hypothetical protein [Streptomyces chartreusis]|uniref:hypothetical protein n=1 Tax=Streptomyces chartreusis TaxID=1969 RepID=UPI0037F45F2C
MANLVGGEGQLADGVFDLSVTHGLGGRSVRRVGWGAPGPQGSCRDLQPCLVQGDEDRRDGVNDCSHLVDEGDDQRFRGSSSPARKIVADFKTSLTSRSRLSSSRSSLIMPAA